MAIKALVAMNPQGRITVPASARQLLHVEGETQFEMEATEREIVLRPALVIPREDAWAYTPEHLASLQRAIQQVNEGRLRPASERDFGGDEGDEGEDEVQQAGEVLIGAAD